MSEEIIEQLRNQNAELRDELDVKNAELNKELEKNMKMISENIYLKEELQKTNRYSFEIDKLKEELNKEKEKNKELEKTLKQTQDSWYEDAKKIELNNECEIALNNRIMDLEYELKQEKEKNKELEEKLDTEKYANRQKSVKIFKLENDYISKDKIKAKIEELEKEQKDCILYKHTLECDECMEHCWTFPMIRVLQELLEEEE